MNYRVLFILSLAANLLLLGVVFWPAAPLPSAAPPDAAKSLAAPAAPPVRGEDPATIASRPKSPLGWADAMTQFREAGVPSEILAKLVVEKIALKWTPLEKQFEEQYLNDKIDAKRLGELHDQRADELDEELRLALGAGYAEWDKRATVDNMYLGGLTPSEAQREALYPVQKDYLARLHALEVAKRNGQMDEKAWADAQKRVETDYRSRLVEIIGPDRVDSMAGQDDPHVQVRRDFSQLKLSGQQMTELAAVQKKWLNLRGTMAESLEQSKTMDPAYDGDLRAIDQARDEELSRIMGQEAFDAWQKSTDDRFNTLKTSARDWKLDPAQIDSVYKAVRAYDLAVAGYEYQAQTRAQEGKPVDWSTVEMAIAEYTRQTESALRQYLGNERFEQMHATEVFGLRHTAAPDRERPGRSSSTP